MADLSYPTSALRRGRVQGKGHISPTITTSCGVSKIMDNTVHDYMVTAQDGEEYGIFNLTPRECGRLMGVNDEDITKMLSVMLKWVVLLLPPRLQLILLHSPLVAI